jgi:hypothetical protein
MLDWHCIFLAASRALCTAGISNPTSKPITASTTSSSTNVAYSVFEQGRMKQINAEFTFGAVGQVGLHDHP